MRFIIEGKVKAAVRMTNRSRWTDPQAQEYLDSKMLIGRQVKAQMAKAGLDMLPERTPLRIRLEFLTPSLHIRDLDNLIKTALDSAQGIAFKDDRWVDEIVAVRRSSPTWLTVMEVETL